MVFFITFGLLYPSSATSDSNFFPRIPAKATTEYRDISVDMGGQYL